MAYTNSEKKKAKELFKLSGSFDEVSQQTGIPKRTLRGWKRGKGWESNTDDPWAFDIARLENALGVLHLKKTWNKSDTARFESLGLQKMKLLEAQERFILKERKIERTGEGGERLRNRAKTKKNNDFTALDIKAILKKKRPKFYQFQERFLRCLDIIRFVLKARQIGFTHTFAWEAFENALLTGENQIFISASLRQVGQIRSYIKHFSRAVFGVELKGGDTITLRINKEDENGEQYLHQVELYFLSTNSITSQSYHGNIYIDEICWIPKLRDLIDTALAMAIQMDYRITYISTPSSKSHYSYNIWEGIDQQGNEIPGEITRFKITLDDAINEGYDRITWKKMRKIGYTERQIKFLFKCQWIDDAGSIFKLHLLEKCWFREAALIRAKDGTEKTVMELAKLPQWSPSGYTMLGGFDPNGGGENGDQASLAVGEARPEKLRLVSSEGFGNQSIDWQVAKIKKTILKYRISHFGIDATGIGQQIYHLLKDFPKEVKRKGWNLEIHPFVYDIEVKDKLVWHMERIVAAQQFEYNHDDHVVLQAFSAIKTGQTHGGKSTIRADRKKGIGHADRFWAIAHMASFYSIENSPIKPRQRTTQIGSYRNGKAA